MKDEGCGPYYDFPIDEKFEIDGSGMGCCLIDMDVFDKFKKENIPYFKENWIDIKPDGENVRMNISEDLWFFKKAKELGYRVWCDSSVLCDHMGIETGEIFPTKEEFKKIQRRIEEKKEKVEK